MKSLIIASLCLLLNPFVALAKDTDIAKLYADAGIEATLLIQSLAGDSEYSHNTAKLDLAYPPASTFKIAHSLIALQENTIKDQHEIIRWDGIDRNYEPWNKDHTLATAFAHSCVWCYQIFTQQINDSTYRQYLRTFNYGNGETGTDLSRFWLDGDLRISVRQQVDFLRRVYLRELPISQRNSAILQGIMLTEQTSDYKLWAKTGWSGRNGWYVGYIESQSKVWLFAHYVDIKSKEDLVLRKQLLMNALKIKGITE